MTIEELILAILNARTGPELRTAIISALVLLNAE